MQIFFALLFIVVLMVTSNIVVFRNLINGIYGQVKENNRLVVTNIIQSFDDCFKDINNLIYSIHMLPYDTMVSEDGTLEMYSAYSMRQDIATYVRSSAAYDYIEEVITFYNGSDLAITTAGTIGLDRLLNDQYRNNLYNTEFWKSFYRTKQTTKVLPASEYVESYLGFAQRSRRLLAIAGNNTLSPKNVIVLINVDKLMRHVNQRTMMKGTSLIVMDEDRNVILGTDRDWDLVEVLSEAYLEGGNEKTLKKRNYEYMLFKSEYNDFTYVNKIPYQFADLEAVSNVNRLIMVSAIVIALVMSAMLSLYLIRPVKEIVRLLGGSVSRRVDYGSIQSDIAKIQEENETYRTKMNFMSAEVRRGLIMQAIDAFPINKDFERQMREYFSELLEKEYFFMAGIHLQRVSAEAEKPHQEEAANMLQRELHARWPHLVVFHAGNLGFIALFGLRHPKERKQAMEQLRSFARMWRGPELEGYCIWGAASKAYDSRVEHWRAAYLDITDAIAYRSAGDPGPVFDIEDVAFSHQMYLPLEKIEKAAGCIRSGDSEEAVQTINEIMQENMKRNVHFHQFLHIAKFLYYAMVNQLPAQSFEQRELYAMESDFLTRLEQSYEAEAVRLNLIGTARSISGKSKPEPKGKLDPAFISQYIELHYMENLYLDHMAAVAGTSPKYFSNYFKKTFGVNFVEYLNKIRLAHAREFLKNTELSVSEIGEKTGYLNASTFTSTFKKYYGLSPSDYRKQRAD